MRRLPLDLAALELGGLLQHGVNATNVEERLLRNRYDLPDPIAMSIAIDPSIATRVTEETVRIHLDGTDERGWSQVVLPTASSSTDGTADSLLGPPIRVVWEANSALFKQQLVDACRAGMP